MSTLLIQYYKALKARKLNLAADIEQQFITRANSYSWEIRDRWIESLTRLSI